MGNVCFSGEHSADPEVKRQDREIQKMLRQDKKRMDSEIKLLLLGAGESGKSTIFKQMKIIHHKGYSKEECMRMRDVIFGNVMQSIRALVQAVQRHSIPYDNPENKNHADRILDISEQQLVMQAGEFMSPEMGQAIKSLWRDPAVQKAYGLRSTFQLNDSANYYLNDIERIASTDYIPTQQDILHARVKTVGIVEADFMIDNYKFKMVDVGGQRNERRKWIHVFDDVTAIIFVTSLSEYDQTLVEDDGMNRMKESLLLFEEICNVRFFKSTSIIVFFNKRDLFEEKIKRVSLTTCFPDYTGGHNYQAALDYIMEKFLMKNRSRQRQIYTHVTCATDTANIRVVFDAVKNIILHHNLSEVNLI